MAKIKKEKCYFCGYNYTTHKHHINGRKDIDKINNTIFLCPNHHSMVHHDKFIIAKIEDSFVLLNMEKKILYFKFNEIGFNIMDVNEMVKSTSCVDLYLKLFPGFDCRTFRGDKIED